MKLAYLQLSVAIWIAVLAACGTSHPQNNSNTNWLRECSASKECNSGEQCACGICTVACTTDDACQSDRAPDAVCASVAELECSGSSKGAVCTAGCERDKDCGDGALSCWQGSCVDLGSTKITPGRDAAVGPEGDAQVEDSDSGVTRPTKPPTQSTTCEERLGCDANSECRDDRCQRLWWGDGCERAAEMRPTCTTDEDCQPLQLCHVDGTCIDPGKCDRFGTSTVAALPVANASALVLTKDDAYVLDYGTVDRLNNHNGDGAVVRVSLADGSTAGLIAGIDQPLGMLIDPTHIHAISGVPVVTIVSADRSDLSNRVELTASQPFSLAHDAGHLYFPSKQSDGTFELSRVTSGTTALEKLTDEHWDNVDFVAVDGQYAYVTVDGAMQRVPLAGGPLAAPFPYPLSEYAIDRDHLFYSEPPPNQGMITALSKDGTKVTTLVDAGRGAPNFLKAYRGHVYFLRYLQNSQLAELSRIAITPGSEDVFATLSPPALGVNAFDVSDQGLFWVQDHHLVRQIIEDFGQSVTPAQGSAGGPCYGDLACDDGLSCVDSLCTFVPPTCEERLGCPANTACLNEHCKPLWSGDGCDPAADGRPACTTDEDCGSGLVCHVDGTCIEPGKCDRFGMTTLATVGDVAAMTVTKDSVFVLDKSTDDALGNDQSTGAIQNVSIADGNVQTVIDHLYRPLDVKVDGARVYWQHGKEGEIGFGWADRADGGNPGDVVLGGDVGFAEWLLSSDHVYVLEVKSADRDWLLRFAKGSTTLETLSDRGLHGRNDLAMDRDYVYFDAGRRWSLADSMVLEPTPTSANVTAPCFVDHERIYHVGFDGIGYTTKADDHRVVLATASGGYMFWLKAYRDHVYWLSGRLPADKVAMDSIVQRAPLTPGDTETVAYLPDGTRLADISDRGLFSIQGHRLVREVIEDYASGPSPAQGAAGAPCFGDQTCNSGLSCVESICEQVQP